MTDVDRLLMIARELQPNVWTRTEQVARIIMPEAFEDGVTLVHPESARTLYEARMACQRSVALLKAQAVVTFLGVNTDTEVDWFEILTRLAKGTV